MSCGSRELLYFMGGEDFFDVAPFHLVPSNAVHSVVYPLSLSTGATASVVLWVSLQMLPHPGYRFSLPSSASSFACSMAARSSSRPSVATSITSAISKQTLF